MLGAHPLRVSVFADRVGCLVPQLAPFTRRIALLRQLGARKSIDKLISDSVEPGHSLKKSLGPWSLTALGIGAVIGSGIFTVIGTAISGETFDAPSISNTPLIHYVLTHTALAGRPGAGPAIAVSLFLVAIVCALTGLCYAELASMIPIAGSAYTYTYATLGELIAWIIGWDLILEYAGSNMTVSVGFAAHVVDLLDWFGFHPSPIWLSPAYLPGGLQDLSGNWLYHPGWHFGFNIPAFLIVLILTVILVRGIRESASTNNMMVGIKLIAILIFVFAVIGFIHPGNWHPFMPNGWSGVLTGGSIIFFTYIGFDSVSTAAEECRNPQRDLPIGIIATLVICTVLYVAVAVCLTGLVPWQSMVGDAAPVVNALKKLSILPGGHSLHWIRLVVLVRRHHGHALVDPRLPARPVARLVLHVPRRPAAQSLQQRASRLPHSRLLHLGGRASWSPSPPASSTSAPSPISPTSARSSPLSWSPSASSCCATASRNAAAASAFPLAPSFRRSASSSAFCSWPDCRS